MIDFSIRNPREYRLLKRLLVKPTFRKELNEIIGAINTPQNVLDIRKRGLTIPCKRVSMHDRDGNKSNPGIYSLTDEDALLAKEAVKKWENGGATPSPKMDK